MAASREPEEIYEETRKEGRRRLSRPVVELAATALVGGFDVAFGVAAYALAASAVGGSRGRLAGAIAFGIGFVFIVVGKSELFTENFLIPIAGLNRRDRGSWFKLGELWAVALVLNIVGGLLIVVVMTSHGVLRHGSAQPLLELADHVTDYSTLAAFLSALIAGALMTLMTWFVEGAATSLGVRIIMAWIDHRPRWLQPCDRFHDRASLRDAPRQRGLVRIVVHEPRPLSGRQSRRRIASRHFRARRAGNRGDPGLKGLYTKLKVEFLGSTATTENDWG